MCVLCLCVDQATFSLLFALNSRLYMKKESVLIHLNLLECIEMGLLRCTSVKPSLPNFRRYLGAEPNVMTLKIMTLTF